MALLRLQSFYYLSLRRLSTGNYPPSDKTEIRNSTVPPQKRNFCGKLRQFVRRESKTENSDAEHETDERNSNNGAEKDERGSESQSWSSEFDLLINCIGFSVGLGNIWRFPYVAFKNGGGAFLIPYLILTFVISIPLYYMELFIGQNSKLDPVNVWSFCPIFKGLGATILLCSLFIQVYYNVIMAYTLIYLVHTFRSILPWSGCFEWWGADENCYEVKEGIDLCESLNQTVNSTDCINATENAADQFFKVYVLGLSSGLDDAGTVKWDLAVALLVTWIIVWILVIVRYHSKIRLGFKTVYITAFFPFIILAVYFFYAVTLPGAAKGLNELFVPNWNALLDIRVWSEAAQTSMYSVGIGTGGLIIFGGKSGYRFNISRCTFISCMVDTFGGVLAATVTFMVVGFLAELFNLKFSETTLSGHGLIFVTFPNAVLKMDIPHLWALGFFLMLFCLAVDVTVGTTQAIILGIHALFCPSEQNLKPIVTLTLVFLFLAGLSCVTNGGAFFLNILDYYAGGQSLMGTVLLESIAFGWGYGINEASDDIKKMHGSTPNFFMKLCWTVLAPVALILMFFYSLKDFHLVPLYNIPYPSYAEIIGWSIMAVILLPVPIWMGIVLFQHRKDIRQAFQPGTKWTNAVLQAQNNNV